MNERETEGYVLCEATPKRKSQWKGTRFVLISINKLPIEFVLSAIVEPCTHGRMYFVEPTPSAQDVLYSTWHIFDKPYDSVKGRGIGIDDDEKKEGEGEGEYDKLLFEEGIGMDCNGERKEGEREVKYDEWHFGGEGMGMNCDGERTEGEGEVKYNELSFEKHVEYLEKNNFKMKPGPEKMEMDSETDEFQMGTPTMKEEKKEVKKDIFRLTKIEMDQYMTSERFYHMVDEGKKVSRRIKHYSLREADVPLRNYSTLNELDTEYKPSAFTQPNSTFVAPPRSIQLRSDNIKMETNPNGAWTSQDEKEFNFDEWESSCEDDEEPLKWDVQRGRRGIGSEGDSEVDAGYVAGEECGDEAWENDYIDRRECRKKARRDDFEFDFDFEDRGSWTDLDLTSADERNLGIFV